jgi:thiamine-monophosphate kinase
LPIDRPAAHNGTVHPFTKVARYAVSALGEEKLILQIRRWLGSASPRAPFGIGDDCAVLPGTPGRQLITVDPVIYRQHFDDRVHPADVGAKLLKRNLSDLAAMGGKPTAAVLALTLDARVDVRWLEKFYRGLARWSRYYRVPIVGGDVAEAEGVLAASLTLLGQATGDRTLTRTGARLGDAIYVTGELGRSLVTGHHFKFHPRLAEGRWLAQRPEVRAMMDVSDGLAKDLHALTPSTAIPALEPTKLPRRNKATVREALSDGEDYELLFVLKHGTDEARFQRAWRRKFPKLRLSQIGKFVRPGKLPDRTIDLEAYHGHEHLIPLKGIVGGVTSPRKNAAIAG